MTEPDVPRLRELLDKPHQMYAEHGEERDGLCWALDRIAEQDLRIDVLDEKLVQMEKYHDAEVANVKQARDRIAALEADEPKKTKDLYADLLRASSDAELLRREVRDLRQAAEVLGDEEEPEPEQTLGDA